MRGYLTALDQVITRVPADVTIIPGHGEITNVAGLRILRQYVADLLDAAGKARAAGTSKDDFVKSVELPAYKDWDGYPLWFRLSAAPAYDEAR